jgi:hypothetical protein
MQTNALWLVNVPLFFSKTRLHGADISGKFPFRQGLWIEDLRTPPGQECSNGSLILLAVVLWRAFVLGKGASLRARASLVIRHETAESQNGSLHASDRKVRQAAGLHSLAETIDRSSPAIAAKEQPRHDNREEPEWHRLRHRRSQGEQGCEIFGVSQIAETL